MYGRGAMVSVLQKQWDEMQRQLAAFQLRSAALDAERNAAVAEAERLAAEASELGSTERQNKWVQDIMKSTPLSSRVRSLP